MINATGMHKFQFCLAFNGFSVWFTGKSNINKNSFNRFAFNLRNWKLFGLCRIRDRASPMSGLHQLYIALHWLYISDRASPMSGFTSAWHSFSLRSLFHLPFSSLATLLFSGKNASHGTKVGSVMWFP